MPPHTFTVTSTTTTTTVSPSADVQPYPEPVHHYDPTKPPFTLANIHAAIPEECFVKSDFWSIAYWARDVSFLAVCYSVYPFVTSISAQYWYLPKILWWNIVGFLAWCLFVVGHDCGHRTFSESLWVCDLFGHLSHVPLLVPFHGWRISHRKHHLHHNDLDLDQVWRPLSFSVFMENFRQNNFSCWVAYVIRYTWVGVAIGYPLYLWFDSKLTASGNHYNPWSRLFLPSERMQGLTSSVLCACFAIFLLYSFPLMTLLDAYVVPYFIFVFWLDMVTYLHHTSEDVHYYRGDEWSYLKGGLSTIDRLYGNEVLEHLHHDIGRGHVVHHLFFTKIPHYNLNKATQAIRPLLGPYYHFDETPTLQALWHNFQMCKFVADEGKAVKYEHDEGAAAKRMAGKKL